MRNEIIDKKTGAIIFKKDKDSLSIEKKIRVLEDKISSYEKKISSLEKKIKKIESLQKENS